MVLQYLRGHGVRTFWPLHHVLKLDTNTSRTTVKILPKFPISISLWSFSTCVLTSICVRSCEERQGQLAPSKKILYAWKAYCFICRCSRYQSHLHCVQIRETSTVHSSSHLCLNCLRPGHFLKDCRSSYRRCKRGQKSHYVTTCMGIKSDLLLMTCHVLAESPNGSSMKARALLDSAFLHIRKTCPEFESSSLQSRRTDLWCGWSCKKLPCSIYCVSQQARR